MFKNGDNKMGGQISSNSGQWSVSIYNAKITRNINVFRFFYQAMKK